MSGSCYQFCKIFFHKKKKIEINSPSPCLPDVEDITIILLSHPHSHPVLSFWWTRLSFLFKSFSLVIKNGSWISSRNGLCVEFTDVEESASTLNFAIDELSEESTRDFSVIFESDLGGCVATTSEGVTGKEEAFSLTVIIWMAKKNTIQDRWRK